MGNHVFVLKPHDSPSVRRCKNAAGFLIERAAPTDFVYATQDLIVTPSWTQCVFFGVGSSPRNASNVADGSVDPDKCPELQSDTCHDLLVCDETLQELCQFSTLRCSRPQRDVLKEQIFTRTQDNGEAFLFFFCHGKRQLEENSLTPKT